jgi:predicted 2-oxoglutarate/Fe(II)-dependent dioxygenase YbiX
MNVDLNALALNDIVYNNNYIFKVHTNEVKEVKEVKSTPVHTSSTNNCQYKTTINDEWKKWVQRQLQNNTNKSKIEASLKKQNYSPQLINSLLYNISITSQNQYTPPVEISEDLYQQTALTITDNTSFLEVGDFFPFVKIGGKEMHNFIDSKFILFICVNDTANIDYGIINAIREQYHVLVVYNVTSYCSDRLTIPSSNIHHILEIPENDINIYILNANRRVVDIKKIKNLEDINQFEFDYKFDINKPYLIVENVLSPELLAEVLQFYKDNIHKSQLHDTNSKNRLHVHPDIELERKIDNKLSRALFPEIRKIFYLDVKYRELYKICSYNAETSGRFHAHRDTPHPFQHRKFGLSLLLNDDYDGGELLLPEYNIKLKPKANTAIIFPGICTHQVAEVIKGSRQTIISFLCSEVEGKTKGKSKYSVKSNFFEERKIESSQIYPI